MLRLLVTTLAGGAVLSAAPILIDNFNTSQFLQVGPGGVNPLSGFNSVATGVNAIGGFRAVNLTRTIGSGIANVDVNLSEPSLFSYSNGASVVSQLLVWWDGDSNSTLDFTNFAVDLTGGGTNTGILIGNRSDLVVSVSLRLYTDAANYSTANFNTAGLGTLVPFTNVFLPFASFTPTGAGANFTNITAALLSMTGPASFDLQLDFLEATNPIPEPMSALLLGGALLGLGVYGRRRAVNRK
jgi:hypothetical protein